MSNRIKLDHSTVVSGTTSTGNFLIANINNKQAGIPFFTLATSTPAIELIDPPVDIKLIDAPTVNSAASYGAGLAVMVNDSAFAIPMYKVAQNLDIIPQFQVDFASIALDLTYSGSFLVIKNNEEFYGVPLLHYNTLYYGNSATSAFTLTTGVSTLNGLVMPYISVSGVSGYDIYQYAIPKTQLSIGSPTKDFNNGRGSTNLNNKIKTYSQLIQRIKYALGYPFVNVELCDDTQMCDAIDQAIEWYTKYAGYTEEFLVFHSSLYTEPGLKIDKLFSITPTMRSTLSNGASGCWDYDLGDYRKVIGLFEFQQGETTGINTLFTLEQAMAQQTYFSYQLGNVGFDLVTWEVMKGWLELREKVLAQRVYVDFDNRNQLLRLIPAPNSQSRYYGVVGCWVEKAIQDLIMERWVYQYSLALCKMIIGNVRGKYQGMQLFGGGTLNSETLLGQGMTEKKELEEELKNGYGEVTPPRFFVGLLVASLVPMIGLFTDILNKFI